MVGFGSEVGNFKRLMDGVGEYEWIERKIPRGNMCERKNIRIYACRDVY